MWAFRRSVREPEHALLDLLIVADGGLTTSDLTALTGIAPAEIDEHMAAESWVCRRASRWRAETVYVVEIKGLTVGQIVLDECRGALHAWADRYREQGWPATTPEYLLDGYFRLLHSTGDLSRMTACATDPRRHQRLLELTGGDVAATHEVVKSKPPDWRAATTLEVFYAWLTQRNNKLPTSLPATMAASGDPIRAEQLAYSITDPPRQATALTSLAIALIDHGHAEQARHTIDRLAAVMPAFENMTGAPEVAELAAAGQWTSAQRVALSLATTYGQAKALRVLVSAQIAEGHLDQAEYLAVSINDGRGDSEALTSVIAALAASGQYRRAEALARAFPDRTARDSYGGILALPELVTAAGVAGENKKFHKLVRCAPHAQIRDRLITDAVGAVAQAGDFDRAESLAHSISSDFERRTALAEVVDQLLTAGERERATALARSVAIRTQQDPDRSLEQDLNDVLRARRRQSRAQDPPRNGLGPAFAMAHAQLDAGDPDQAERTAHAAGGTPLLTQLILCSLAVALVERGKTDRAERLALGLDEPHRRAEVLAAAASASAAYGDSASALRLAACAETLARASTFDDQWPARPPNNPNTPTW